MALRKLLLKELRRLGFKFYRETKKVELWKKKGSTQRVIIPKRKIIDPMSLGSSLSQAGMTDQQITTLMEENEIIK